MSSRNNIEFVAADRSKWVAWGQCQITEIFGFNNQGTDRWVQFHETPVLSGGETPVIKPAWVSANAGFKWTWESLQVKELYVAISDAELTYSDPGANAGIDMTLVVQSDFLVKSGTTVAGDLTSNVNTLQVWSEAAGAAAPKKLLRLDVTNSAGDTAYVTVHALDTPSTTAPKRHLGPLAIDNLATKNYFFGRDGTRLLDKTPAGVKRQGCTVKMATGGTIPYTFDSGNYKIRAIYE